jgi:hypothetical protein
MKFGNLFYHGTSVSVGSHNPTWAIPCFKFSKSWAIFYTQKKGFWVVRLPLFPKLPAPQTPPNSPHPQPPPNSESTWKHAFFP